MYTTEIVYLTLCSKKKRYEACKDTLNKLKNDIIRFPLNNAKNYKHNPFAEKDIKSIDVRDDKTLHVKYKNKKHNDTILFNYNEKKHRSFSFEQNTQNHLDIIFSQIECELNIIQLNIDWIITAVDKLRQGMFDSYDIHNTFNVDYNIDDIIVIKKHKGTSYDCYLSVCPIYGFLLDNGKIYIANQYQFKFEPDKTEMFYTHKYNFKRMLSRPRLKNFILHFNQNSVKITTDNFINVINNMSSIFNEVEFTNIQTGERFTTELEEIDKPLKVSVIKTDV